MRWVVNLARMGERKNCPTVFVGKPDVKRLFRIPGLRREADTEMGH
jgi:hypothetical protein